MKASKCLILMVSVLVFSFGCSAEQKQAEGVGLTIYNDNFGVVRQARQMNFDKGVNTMKFTDVASAIDPTSVNFKCLSSPGAISILEQNYEYDLVNSASLLKRYIDKKVTVVIGGGGADAAREIQGKLLAAVGSDYIVEINGGVEIVNRDSVEEIALAELPEGLVTRPTLMWLASAEKAGQQLCQVTYTTEQINWKADYTAILSDDEKTLDFSGWVTIDNKSGAAYKDAALKLIAGDVRRIRPPQPQVMYRALGAEMEAKGGFEEKAFMEYHMYTLGRKSTINNNQVKQIEFIEPALGVAAKKIFVYDRQENAEKVQVEIEFENTEENKLGIALPKGKVRVFKKDPADENLEFVGEDMIDHTPRKEKLSLYIGNAFDIVPEYKLVKSEWGRSRRSRTETHQIELRNRKDEPVEVFVDEKFSKWVNWEVQEKSHEYENYDAYTARFKVKIPADSTEMITYTVKQWW
ncbi:MAG: DUF4139 domain-containing protein [Sedimentisphaerales bacterium]|nr:DUF4139 domain-containing protein [Sedimentisphaerales bacterium]